MRSDWALIFECLPVFTVAVTFLFRFVTMTMENAPTVENSLLSLLAADNMTLSANSGNVVSSWLSETDPLPQTVTAKKKRGLPFETTNNAKKGRPSGTANAEKGRPSTAKKNCIHEITRLYVAERKKVSEQKIHTNLPAGFLSDLIFAQKLHFNALSHRQQYILD
jgi:hypothetical protein